MASLLMLGFTEQRGVPFSPVAMLSGGSTMMSFVVPPTWTAVCSVTSNATVSPGDPEASPTMMVTAIGLVGVVVAVADIGVAVDVSDGVLVAVAGAAVSVAVAVAATVSVGVALGPTVSVGVAVALI